MGDRDLSRPVSDRIESFSTISLSLKRTSVEVSVVLREGVGR